MREDTGKRSGSSRTTYDTLEAVVREKVRQYIQDILEEEVEAALERKKCERRRGVDKPQGYRNGHGKPRRLALMSGTITIRRPRVRDMEKPFASKILPLFKRRTRELEQMLPELYLHGLSTGDFDLALRGLLGDGAPLSSSSIQRLKAKWQIEYEQWKAQDLSTLEAVYQWADGIYVKAGLEKDKAALLVVVGALSSGEKVLLACESGYRESKESWSAILRDLRGRGLVLGRLTIADGHLGIWSALAEQHPLGQQQRCWNHKITNVVDSLPKRLRAEAGEYLSRIPYAETRQDCERLKNGFTARYGKEFPKAVETLERDWDRMVTFYDFPREHWKHIRTTNVIESPFSAVRLRTDAAKRFKKVTNATAMIWKLLTVAEKSFRRLDAFWLLRDVYAGKTFVNGIAMEKAKSPERKAA